MNTAAEIGQDVRRCRKANDAMRRACRNQGFPSGRYGTVKRNKRRFRKHWREFWRLSADGRLAVHTLDQIPADHFTEPSYGNAY